MTTTREHYTLTVHDVGRKYIKAFGKSWPTMNFIGQVLPGDVGKRVYEADGILQVENDEQMAKRMKGITCDCAEIGCGEIRYCKLHLSAPSLLAALKSLVRRYEEKTGERPHGDGFPGGNCGCSYCIARAAIESAGG